MEAGIFSEGSSWVLAGERVVETGGTGSGFQGIQERHPGRKEMELISEKHFLFGKAEGNDLGKKSRG